MPNVVPIEQVQAGLITYLKSITALITALGNASQIKEYFWQGQDFVYPGVRLQMGIAKPASPEPRCAWWNQPFYVLCFSEQKSSKQCSQLASIVATMHGFQPGKINGVDFNMLYVDQIVPPIRQDELTWRSEVIAHSTINL
jgi:hypothetical protein